MRKLHVSFIVLAALSASAIYLVAGLYYVILPAGDGLQSRLGPIAGADFRAFYVAGRMVAEGAVAEIYDLQAYSARSLLEIGSTAEYSWSYPPVAFFWVSPLAAFPYLPAMFLWGLLPMATMAWLSYRILPHVMTPVVAMLSLPLVHNFIVGQNGALSAAILGGGLLLLPARPVVAGLVFALAIYKPHLAVLLPVCLLAGRHYTALAAMAGGGLALILASLAIFGLGSWLAFFAHLADHMGHVDSGGLPIHRLPTFYAVAQRLFGDVALARLVQVAGSVAVIIAVAWIWRRTERPAGRALALTAGTLLATPYAFDYDLVILVVPFVWLLKDYVQFGKPTLDPFALLAIWLAALLAFFIDAAIGWVLLILLLVYGPYRERQADHIVSEGEDWRAREDSNL